MLIIKRNVPEQNEGRKGGRGRGRVRGREGRREGNRISYLNRQLWEFALPNSRCWWSRHYCLSFSYRSPLSLEESSHGLQVRQASAPVSDPSSSKSWSIHRESSQLGSWRSVFPSVIIRITAVIVAALGVEWSALCRTLGKLSFTEPHPQMFSLCGPG